MIETELLLEKKHLTDSMALSKPEVLMVGYSESVMGTYHFGAGKFKRIDVWDVGFPNRADLVKVNLFTVFARPYSTIIIDDTRAENPISLRSIKKLIELSAEGADIFIHGDSPENLTRFTDDNSLELRSYVSNIDGDYVASFRKSTHS